MRPAPPGRAGQPWSVRLLSALVSVVLLAGIVAAATARRTTEAAGGQAPPTTVLDVDVEGPAAVDPPPVSAAPPTTLPPAAPVETAPPATDAPPATTAPPATAAAPQAPPSSLQPDPSAGGAAHRMIVWTGCADVVALTDAELDRWRDRGVGGFVCSMRWLRPFGGTQDFTADPNHPLATDNYSLQRSIRDSGIVARAAARGLKLYLGMYLVNYNNRQTPLAEWFDDGAWSTAVLPALRDVAGAAHLLGFAGLAFDEELYPQRGGSTATWSWDYPGRSRSEAEVRATARRRGAEVMSAIVGAFPDVELVDYYAMFPETWSELVQLEINDIPNAHVSSVQIDFLDGLTSVEGYRAIRFLDATFYKTPHLSGATWDAALQYDVNRFYSLLSRRLSNWLYASSRIHRSPFAWINAGETNFERARPPDYVASQLDAFRRWGLGGEFGNYAFDGLDGFDYGPYESAMRAAAQPGVVDDQPPALHVGEVSVENGTAQVRGHATDNMAVRIVGWSTSAGHVGAAAMTWRVLRGDYRSGYEWQMDWTAAVPVAPGPNTLTLAVQDAKGLVTTVELLVQG